MSNRQKCKYSAIMCPGHGWDSLQSPVRLPPDPGQAIGERQESRACPRVGEGRLSALQAGQGDALDETALGEEEGQEHRQGDERADGHQIGIGQLGVADFIHG